MKKLFVLLTLTVAAAACRHQPPPTQVATASPVAPAKPVAALPEVPAPAALPDSLTPAMRTMLRQTNLTELFTATAFEKEANYQPVLDGFFIGSPQRLSLTILQATRDSLRPGRFQVMGKTRFKQQISRFEGIISLVNITDYYEQGLLLSQGNDKLTYVADSTLEAGGYIANARAYSATATFRFSSTAPVAHTLEGKMLLDFWVTDKGVVGLMRTPGAGEVLDKAPTKGSGLVLKGNRQGATGEKVKSFVVSQDIFLLSPSLISDFGLGERSAVINPKYVKLGWGNYWDNDEWWADSPKPNL